MLINPQYKYSELTGKIIKAAMEVHKIMGNGFQEVVYQRALAVELSNMGIPFVREQEMPLVYKSVDVGTRRVDFFVDGKIMVELKAIVCLEAVHLAQAINYLEAYNLEIGLLINFGTRKLEFKRLLNKKHKLNPSYFISLSDESEFKTSKTGKTIVNNKNFLKNTGNSREILGS
jgi:GxxExxY protein